MYNTLRDIKVQNKEQFAFALWYFDISLKLQKQIVTKWSK